MQFPNYIYIYIWVNWDIPIRNYFIWLIIIESKIHMLRATLIHTDRHTHKHPKLTTSPPKNLMIPKWSQAIKKQMVKTQSLFVIAEAWFKKCHYSLCFIFDRLVVISFMYKKRKNHKSWYINIMMMMSIFDNNRKRNHFTTASRRRHLFFVASYSSAPLLRELGLRGVGNMGWGGIEWNDINTWRRKHYSVSHSTGK